MDFTAEPMTQAAAEKILTWKYPYPYDFYNNEKTDRAISELLDGTYRVIRNNEGEVFGFYCTGKSAQVPAGRKMGIYPDSYIDFGLGMNPAETGQGKGKGFFDFIQQEILNTHPGKPLRLTVATFNKRATRLYDKFGFVEDKKFRTDFAVFQTMVKKFSKQAKGTSYETNDH